MGQCPYGDRRLLVWPVPMHLMQEHPGLPAFERDHLRFFRRVSYLRPRLVRADIRLTELALWPEAGQ